MAKSDTASRGRTGAGRVSPSRSPGSRSGTRSDQTGAPSDTGPRYLGLARVSTEEQAGNGHSLDAQEARLREEAERRNVELELIPVPARSGKALSPELCGALDRLARGEAQGLMVAKLDRLTRSVAIAADIIKAAQRQGWNLVMLDLGVDLTTPGGKAMAHMLATFAEFERDQIVERTKAGLAAARANGTKSGRPIGRPRLASPEVTRRIRKEREAGQSFAAIAQALTEEGEPSPQGLPVWQASTVRRIYNAEQVAS